MGNEASTVFPQSSSLPLGGPAQKPAAWSPMQSMKINLMGCRMERARKGRQEALPHSAGQRPGVLWTHLLRIQLKGHQLLLGHILPQRQATSSQAPLSSQGQESCGAHLFISASPKEPSHPFKIGAQAPTHCAHHFVQLRPHWTSEDPALSFLHPDHLNNLYVSLS